MTNAGTVCGKSSLHPVRGVSRVRAQLYSERVAEEDNSLQGPSREDFCVPNEQGWRSIVKGVCPMVWSSWGLPPSLGLFRQTRSLLIALYCCGLNVITELKRPGRKGCRVPCACPDLLWSSREWRSVLFLIEGVNNFGLVIQQSHRAVVISASEKTRGQTMNGVSALEVCRAGEKSLLRIRFQKFGSGLDRNLQKEISGEGKKLRSVVAVPWGLNCEIVCPYRFW